MQAMKAPGGFLPGAFSFWQNSHRAPVGFLQRMARGGSIRVCHEIKSYTQRQEYPHKRCINRHCEPIQVGLPWIGVFAGNAGKNTMKYSPFQSCI